MKGFGRLMTGAIITFPEIEYNRLSEALLQLPSKQGIPRDRRPIQGKVSLVFTHSLNRATQPVQLWNQGRETPRRKPKKVRFVDDKTDHYDQSESGRSQPEGRRTSTAYGSTALPARPRDRYYAH